MESNYRYSMLAWWIQSTVQCSKFLSHMEFHFVAANCFVDKIYKHELWGTPRCILAIHVKSCECYECKHVLTCLSINELKSTMSPKDVRECPWATLWVEKERAFRHFNCPRCNHRRFHLRMEQSLPLLPAFPQGITMETTSRTSQANSEQKLC